MTSWSEPPSDEELEGLQSLRHPYADDHGTLREDDPPRPPRPRRSYPYDPMVDWPERYSNGGPI